MAHGVKGNRPPLRARCQDHEGPFLMDAYILPRLWVASTDLLLYFDHEALRVRSSLYIGTAGPEFDAFQVCAGRPAGSASLEQTRVRGSGCRSRFEHRRGPARGGPGWPTR